MHMKKYFNLYRPIENIQYMTILSCVLWVLYIQP
jgi:hypothetical protein